MRSSDPIVLRREAAQCRRLLVDGVVTEEGVKRMLQEEARKRDTLADQIEAGGARRQRERDIDSAYRADMQRRRERA